MATSKTSRGKGTSPPRTTRRAPTPEQVVKQLPLPADGEMYVLRLFVTGMTPRSQRAIENIRTLCQQHLEGRFELEVIDIYQQPALAKGEQIICAPTLIKKLPLPLRRIIGDLSCAGRVLVALGLKQATEP